MKLMCCPLLGICIMTMATAAAAQRGDLLLIVKKAPAHGLVIARATLPAKGAMAVRAMLSDGRAIPAQFIPDAADGSTGTLALRLPKGGDYALKVRTEPASPPAARQEETFGGKGYAIRFAAAKMGGLPSAFIFPKSGRLFGNFFWNDRVYDPKLGSFMPRYDPQARPEVIADGPVCAVVRIRARYCREDGAQPPSEPVAVYDWYVFKDAPLLYVTARVRQREPFAWAELHFLELNFPGQDFTHFAGGDPPVQGELTSAKKATVFGAWGALLNGQDALGMFGNDVRVYDGRGEYGTYLHSTWTTWSDREARLATWLWVGSADDPAKAVQAAAQEYGARGQVVLTTPELHRRIAGLREAAAKKKGQERIMTLWRAALAERLEAGGAIKEAGLMAAGELPGGWSLHMAGDFGLALQKTTNDVGTHAEAQRRKERRDKTLTTHDEGVKLQSLYDLKTGRELLAPNAPPLFTLHLRRASDKQEATLSADAGWKQAQVAKTGDGLTLRWVEPADARLKGLTVTAKAAPDAKAHAWRWTLRVENPGSEWGVMRVAFPQVAIAEPGDGATALYPGGPGLLRSDLWEKPYTQRSMYPNGWCAMQFMAVCGGGAKPAGLYFGLHDPYGGTKEIGMESDPATRSVRLVYDIPAPDMGKPGNGYTLGGQAVWQLLRGDWFDAAMIYKAWARKEAKWWPQLSADGRADTPLWMRELCAWALTGGYPKECVPDVKKMAATLGVPIGFHWYNWHEIPFDNDYPHYFPTKPGVAEGVKELQAANVYVMPYINGRLWDTRDRGAEDYEFTKVARPSATKQENGEPFIESYGSRESDGSPVRLAVMCPTTELWQRTVRETVLRIMNEVGTKGVYIDQIAAAGPALCMDPAHGHPLGGGHWWTEQGYWRLLAKLRAAMPKDRMITTECNAEPYIRWMDGYLTWHWQNDGMVPAFPAVYGGAIQMFSRSYGAGATTRDDALCMKMGQQLVFGEQIGWLDPKIAEEKVAGAFLRDVVRMRHRLRRYFYAGEMARPPKLIGEMPTVRADWQWGGEDWVTTDAVMTGAWRIPVEKRLVLLFANVSDKPVTLTVPFDARAYGIAAPRLSLTVIADPDEKAEAESVPARFERKVTFPPRRAMAWEVRW